MALLLPVFLQQAMAGQCCDCYSCWTCDYPPTGHFDGVNTITGVASGWAYDPDYPTTPLTVNIYNNWQLIGSTTTGLSRPDITAAPNTGWQFTIPSQYRCGSYNFEARAMDSESTSTQYANLYPTPYTTTFAGTLKGTFLYTSGGVDTPLSGAYVYLQDQAPLDKFYQPANAIFGPTDANGAINVTNVPLNCASTSGTKYYVRVVKKASGNVYGPPMPGDLSWMQPEASVFTSSTPVDLGTQHANTINLDPITVSGIITVGGVPTAGRYVRLQTTTYCGPGTGSGSSCSGNHCYNYTSYISRPSGTDGSFVVKISQPGTYYLYVSSSVDRSACNCVQTNNPCVGVYKGSVTVKEGDKLTVNESL